MNRYALLAWCAAAAIASAIATADILYLKDGTSIDGTVVKINDNCLAIRSGTGEIVYQNDEVDRAEKNGKKGTLDLAKANPAALRHEQALEQATGLKAEQREKVLAVVDTLAREDAAERNQAIKQLVAMQQQFDVYRFLRESRHGFGARVLPGVLEVMLTINKSETKAIVFENLDNKTPTIRAAVLKLLGRHKELASVETVARGVIDADLDVRIAAIHALAELGDGRATPVLIGALSNANPRVRNAGKAALTRIWSKPETLVQFETAEEWNNYWSEASVRVGKPIELASLQPLYVQPEGTYSFTHE